MWELFFVRRFDVIRNAVLAGGWILQGFHRAGFEGLGCAAAWKDGFPSTSLSNFLLSAEPFGAASPWWVIDHKSDAINKKS